MTKRTIFFFVAVIFGIIFCCVGIISANNYYFKGVMAYQSDDPNAVVWGAVYRGLALSIFPTQEKYAIGGEIEIAVFLKNLRKEKFTMRYAKHRYFYRMAMFDSDGKPVLRTEDLRESETSVIKPSRIPRGRISIRGISHDPWDVSTEKDKHRTVNLNDWFKINKPGIYTLIVMQPIASDGIQASWKDGFLISNAAKIKVVAK